MEIADTFNFLLGRWKVDRWFEDHVQGTAGKFTGSAILFGLQHDGLTTRSRARYDEKGEMCFGCHAGEAHRSLIYERLENAIVMAYFVDGQPFADLDLTSGRWHASHRCGEDLYEISTVVRSRDVLEERWRVRGPDTAYDAITTLGRLGVLQTYES